MSNLSQAAKDLSKSCNIVASQLQEPVSVVYNPLDYAWDVHNNYLSKYGGLGAKTIILGMNPGPWGMGQTGVPFGDVTKTTSYLGLKGDVTQPKILHPKRPVIGLSCERGEVSGTRLWGIIEEIFGSAEKAHEKFFVINHCPLLMFDEKGTNITPDKLRGVSGKELLFHCDEHLRKVTSILGAERVIGVGAYAEKQAKKALAGYEIEIGRIPHPSPANPMANRNKGADWREAVSNILSNL